MACAPSPRVLGAFVLLVTSLYAALEMLVQLRLEAGSSLLAGPRRRLGTGWGRLLAKQASPVHSAHTTQPTPTLKALQANSRLQAFLLRRVDDSLASVMPATRMMLQQQQQQQEDEEGGERGGALFAAASDWVLRVGHWTRLPVAYARALRHHHFRDEQLSERERGRSHDWLPCLDVYAELDLVLLRPHGCGRGERRYFYVGMWMDAALLRAELTRPGGGGGHAEGEPTCVLACVDVPHPRCSSPALGGFPCAFALVLRQQSYASDLREVEEVYEAQVQPPWTEAFPSGRRTPSSGVPVEDSNTPGVKRGAVLDVGSSTCAAAIFLSTLFGDGVLILSVTAAEGDFRVLAHNCLLAPGVTALRGTLWPQALSPPTKRSLASREAAEQEQGSGPAVQLEGAQLLRMFDVPRFDAVRLDLRHGGEEQLFPTPLAQPPALPGASAGWPSAGRPKWLEDAHLVVLLQRTPKGAPLKLLRGLLQPNQLLELIRRTPAYSFFSHSSRGFTDTPLASSHDRPSHAPFVLPIVFKSSKLPLESNSSSGRT